MYLVLRERRKDRNGMSLDGRNLEDDGRRRRDNGINRSFHGLVCSSRN